MTTAQRAVAICTVLLLSTAQAQAQHIVLGQRIAIGSATQVGNGVTETSGRLAFEAGGFLNVRLGKYLGTRVEASYAATGMSFGPRPTVNRPFSIYLDEVGHDLVIEYLRIPILLETAVPVSDTWRIVLLGGIEQGFALDCDLTTDASVTAAGGTRRATIHSDCGDSTHGTDRGWLVGGGVELDLGSRRIGFSIRYGESFADAYTGQCNEFELDTGPNCLHNTGFDARNRMVRLGVALGFVRR